jgi:hypothetical protein
MTEEKLPWVLIKNDGVLYRGYYRAWPLEIWYSSEGGWAPYKGDVPKGVEWGDIISEKEAEDYMRR